MNKIKVGKIINTHAIKGELKIDTLSKETFDRGVTYYIGKSDEKFEVENVRSHKGYSIVKFKDYNNINDVLKFKGMDIYIEEDDLADLEEDEYYIKDLIGLDIYSSDEKIGVLEDIYEYLANDVYLVRANDGSKMLIPAVDEFILEVNLEYKFIKVKLIEGM
ncbi:ribosome maturation factor RimM [Helcococcus massiliensis]|uniref:ribosome maturation factor RimM n=1 Tax=Helcococcus massiliensis TaxID=2040290 RepID=UPI000CDE6C38|nr:ribosome maturation factor RimM [Helcococcus massiliensis]